MKFAARHLVYLLCVLTSTQLGAQELDIKRSKKKVTTIQEDGLRAGWKRLGDDLFRVRFRLPNFSDMMVRDDPAGEIDDPFGGGTGRKKRFTAQQALEEIGIPFGELASASFDPATKILTVINNVNGIELVDVCVGSYIGQGPPKTIAVRLEIYELTKLQALQIQESAESRRDHAPERAAALAAVRDGDAKLVSVVSVATSSGQRAKLADSVEFLSPGKQPAVAGAGAEKKDSKKADGFEHEKVGTVLEVEPNVDADGQTIDLNLAIAHHTAPPDMDGAAALKLHKKSIVTNVRVIDGEFILIGNWTPTGKPEYANGDLVQVVFITASIQSPGADTEPGSIITDEEKEEEDTE